MTSHSLTKPMNWILHATTFLFAAALFHLSEKDAVKDQGQLCIIIALNVIWN